MAKTPPRRSAVSSSTSSLRVRGLLLVAACVLLAAGIVRFSQRRTEPPTGPQTPVADDSAAELPSPPPAPPPLDLPRLRSLHLTTLAPLASADVSTKIQTAQTAIELGDLFTAERLLRSAQKQEPNSLPARQMLAHLLRRTDRFAEAQDLYLALHREQPHDLAPFVGLAETADTAGRRDQIFSWLGQARSEMSPTLENRIDLAHRYQDWRDFTTAKEIIAEALRLAPGDENALLQRASILVEHDEMEEARPLLEDLLAHHPQNGYACRLLAVVLTTPTSPHQDFARARTLLEKAAELNARDTAIYRVAAIVYRQQRLYRLAAQCYDALLRQDPTDLEGRYGLGQVYALLGKADWSRDQAAIYARLQASRQPLPALDAELRSHPTDPTRHQAKARFLEGQGELTKALAEYETAALLASGTARTQLLTDIRRCYNRLGWPPLQEGTP